MMRDKALKLYEWHRLIEIHLGAFLADLLENAH